MDSDIVWQNTSLVTAESEKIITSGLISGANVNRMATQLDDFKQGSKVTVKLKDAFIEETPFYYPTVYEIKIISN